MCLRRQAAVAQGYKRTCRLPHTGAAPISQPVLTTNLLFRPLPDPEPVALLGAPTRLPGRPPPSLSISVLRIWDMLSG